MTDGYQKQAARSEDFEVVKIRRQGENLDSCEDIIFEDFNPADPESGAAIFRMIDLGGIIGDGVYTNALTHGATTLSITRKGESREIVYGFDSASADYDKYLLRAKGFNTTVQGDISRAMAIDLDNSSAKKYGEYVTDETTVNGTPTTGYNFRYSFGADGHLYLTKNYLSGTLGKKLKINYQSIGWGY